MRDILFRLKRSKAERTDESYNNSIKEKISIFAEYSVFALSDRTDRMEVKMKKIIDSKGKLFGKINIIDLAVIIAVVVLALFTFVKFDRNDQITRSDKVIEYTVLVKQIRQPTVDAMNKNFKDIKEPDTQKALGDITDVKLSKSKEIITLANGYYKEIERYDLFDLLMTLRVQGTETEDNYYTLNGKKLIVGETITLNNQYVTSYGVVKSVEVVNE